MQILFSILIFATLCFRVSHSTVLELDDRFRDARKTGEWLVMFYAPWCGHCKQLEPTWMELGEAMKAELPVHVARLDCTRYSSISGEYGIRGFPTIKFITGTEEYEYRGARLKKDIISFVRKARGPKTSVITGHTALKTAQNNHDVFYLYVGSPDTDLRKNYELVAEKLFLTLNLFIASPDVMPDIIDTPTVLVFKDGSHYKMPLSSESSKTSQLSRWMLSEQRPDYSELSGVSYQSLKNTHKSFAIAVLPTDTSEKKLNSVAKEIATSRDELFHPKFIFCWVKDNSIVDRITYGKISTPNFVVINPENYEYHVLRDAESKKSIGKGEIKMFLNDIIEGKLTALGGSGILQQLRRFFSDTTSSIVSFFAQSPIVASLVIGIPTFVITFLCYCLCTMEDSGDDGGYGTDSENEDEFDEKYPEDGEQLPEYEDEDHAEVRRRNIDNDMEEESNEQNGSGDMTETDKDK